MSKAVFDDIADGLPAFFTGANSGVGFYSCFDDIYDPFAGDRLYILKGGPGTGKSTLMKRAAADVAECGETPTLCFCSSDPDSLDAVIFERAGCAVADGTAPHVMDAKFPGVSERIISLGDCLDCDLLESKAGQLFPLFKANSELHKKASRFIKAAAGLLDDSFAIDCECTALDRAQALGEQLANELIPDKETGIGREKRRFLSGMTPKGTVFFEHTLELMCDRIFVIEDEYGGSSSVIMSVLRSAALERGHNIITCPCALHPNRKIDHIIIPDLRVGICTSSTRATVRLDTERRIHARRFRDSVRIRDHRQRLSFNRRAAGELLDEAGELLYEAKEVHDLIEAFYIEAMDFELADQMAEKIESGIKTRLLME